MRSKLSNELRSASLFSGLDDTQLDEVAGLVAPWRALAGDTLFRQGDEGDRLFVLTEGRLEVSSRVGTASERKLGEIEPGEMVGELSLLVGGPRTATVRAIEGSSGLALTREAFEFLRVQLRPVALELVRRVGETALQRLRGRYLALGASEAPSGSATAFPAPPLTAYTGNAVHDDYLSEILFFRRFKAPDIAALCDGLQLLYGPRGARLDVDGRLWIIVRGAVETDLQCDDRSMRVRLAGPGRCVGHLGLDEGTPLSLQHTLRERAILLELPSGPAKALLAGEGPGARRFAEAFHEDVVRALIDVELAASQPVVKADPGSVAREPSQATI